MNSLTWCEKVGRVTKSGTCEQGEYLTFGYIYLAPRARLQMCRIRPIITVDGNDDQVDDENITMYDGT